MSDTYPPDTRLARWRIEKPAIKKRLMAPPPDALAALEKAERLLQAQKMVLANAADDTAAILRVLREAREVLAG